MWNSTSPPSALGILAVGGTTRADAIQGINP